MMMYSKLIILWLWHIICSPKSCSPTSYVITFIFTYYIDHIHMIKEYNADIFFVCIIATNDWLFTGCS